MLTKFLRLVQRVYWQLFFKVSKVHVNSANVHLILQVNNVTQSIVHRNLSLFCLQDTTHYKHLDPDILFYGCSSERI